MSGIYIHIPFCHKRCIYCDFYLVTNKDLIGTFIDNLLIEIELYSSKYPDEEFDTIYFGGGTPSILSAGQFGQIISHLKKKFKVSGHSEITIEANPEDLITRDINEFTSSGLNRISLGVQSFKDDELRFLTREHSSAIAEDVISKTKKEIDNINIDIIYSLPGQAISDLEYSLTKAVSLGAKHISAYSLTYEPNTVLFKNYKNGSVKKNKTEYESEQFKFVNDFLSHNGFSHYEVSNYSLPGFESRHNLKYWSFKNYLGMGPSSHSFFNGERWNNKRSISKYNSELRQGILPAENHFVLTEQQKKFEYVMLGLRSRGLSIDEYNKIFSNDFLDEYHRQVEELTGKNFAKIENRKFFLTESGLVLADEIIARYF